MARPGLARGLFLLLGLLILSSCARMPFLSPATWAEFGNGLDTEEAPTEDDPIDDPVEIPPVTPDDGQDDTADLQAALDTAATLGVDLVLPGGTFEISGPLVPQGGTVIRGAADAETIITTVNPAGQTLFDNPAASGIELHDLVLENVTLSFSQDSQDVVLSDLVSVIDTAVTVPWIIEIVDSHGVTISGSSFLVSSAVGADFEGVVRVDRATNVTISDNLIGADLASTDYALKFGKGDTLQRLVALRTSGLFTDTAMDKVPNGVKFSRDDETDVAWDTVGRVVNNLFNGDNLVDPVSLAGYAIAGRMLNGFEIGGNHIEGFAGSAAENWSVNLVLCHNLSFSGNYIVASDVRFGITGYNDIRSVSSLWLAGNVMTNGNLVYIDSANSGAFSTVSDVVFCDNTFETAGNRLEFSNEYLNDHDAGDLIVDQQNYNNAEGATATVFSDGNTGTISTPAVATMPPGVSGYYNPGSYRVY